MKKAPRNCRTCVDKERGPKSKDDNDDKNSLQVKADVEPETVKKSPRSFFKIRKEKSNAGILPPIKSKPDSTGTKSTANIKPPATILSTNATTKDTTATSAITTTTTDDVASTATSRATIGKKSQSTHQHHHQHPTRQVIKS